MTCFKVHDVKGDGSCYYRCVWKLAKEHSYIAESLYVNDVDDEDRGVEEIREYVALSLKYEKHTKHYLKNLLDLYKQVPELVQNYPLLSVVDLQNDTFDETCKKIAYRIENTKMMASSFEHEVISQRLSTTTYDSACDLNIIILSQHEDMDKDDLAEKWLFDLAAILPKLTCKDVAIFVNEDNIHYKYVRFNNDIVIDRQTLLDYVNDKVEEETEDETETEELS